MDSGGLRAPSSDGSPEGFLESRLPSGLVTERHTRHRVQLLSLASCRPGMFSPHSSRSLSLPSKSLYSLTGVSAHFTAFTILQLSCARVLPGASGSRPLSAVLSFPVGLVGRPAGARASATQLIPAPRGLASSVRLVHTSSQSEFGVTLFKGNTEEEGDKGN